MTTNLEPIDDTTTASEPGSLRAPFPWFGGKRRVAAEVWARFGDVDSYNEPFAGSLAVLLGRPHAPRVETVNDLDCYLANFWRALQADPAGVAYYADSPVNEADLHARHRWLVERARPHAERVMYEPDFYDVKVAGWWVWGQCLWIGSGWCATEDKRNQVPYLQRKKARAEAVGCIGRRWQGGGQGGGSGVHAPRLTQKMPRISAEGGSISGVTSSTYTRQMPQLSGDGSGAQRGLLREGVRATGLYAYLGQLAARLRRVRVCCGDWRRVLTPSVTTYVGVTGVFLDPPYTHDLRERCYSEDHDISADVRAWALAHGDDPKLRIALCGYEGEHDMPPTWACVPWRAHGGYARTERGRANRDRERIWFSPHCLPPTAGPLFQGHHDEDNDE